MGLSVTREDGIVVIFAAGEVMLQEVQDVFAGLDDGEGAEGPTRILVDDLGSDFAPVLNEVRSLVSFWSTLFSDADVRIAIVVAKEFHYGLGRQLSSLSPSGSPAISVFREKEEALQWLESRPKDTR